MNPKDDPKEFRSDGKAKEENIFDEFSAEEANPKITGQAGEELAALAGLSARDATVENSPDELVEPNSPEAIQQEYDEGGNW